MSAAEPEPSTSEAATNLAQYVEAKGIKLTGTPLYLDMQATTPIDPRVLDSMLPFLTEQFGNPHSRTHFFGWESEDAVEIARKQVGARRLQHLTTFAKLLAAYLHVLNGCQASRAPDLVLLCLQLQVAHDACACVC